MVAVMTAQPAMPDPREPYEVIHLGGQTTLAAHRQWAAAGRPGAVSHDQAMAELLAEP